MSDEFTTYDAAYVLGALSQQDRSAYEQHLEHCQSCQASVSRLAGIPGLLGRVPPPDAAAPTTPPDAAGASTAGDLASPARPPLPAQILPHLLTEVARRRTRRRQAIGVCGLAAAALTIVLALTGLPIGDSAPAARDMTAVVQAAPITATAQIEGTAWGTHITLHCRYRDAEPTYDADRYKLIVKDEGGRTQQIATWRVAPGQVSTVEGSTALSAPDIASVEVQSMSGRPVLTLSP